MSCRFEGLQVASAWIVKFPVRVNRRAGLRRAMAVGICCIAWRCRSPVWCAPP